MALTRMLQRRGTFSQWDAVKEDLVLQAGEIGLETNTGKFKIGNGVDDWATLEYVLPDDENELKYAQLSGGNTFTGDQTVNGAITADETISSLGDISVGADLTVFGNITSGQINVSGSKIIGVPDPESDTDAANKRYVDEVVAGLAWKEAAHLFSNSNVATSGTTGTLVIDGHDPLVAADDGIYRIILNGQTIATQNGIYVYTDDGTDYTLERATDALTADLLQGASIYIQEGTVYGTSSWVQSNYTATTFDELVWVQFSGAALITDGAGLLKEGNALSVIGTANRISVTPDNVDIDANYVGQTSIDTLGDVQTGTWSADTIDVEHGGTGATTASAALENLGLTATAAEINTLDGINTTSSLETRLSNDESGISSLFSAVATKATTGSSSDVTFGTVTANNYDIPVSVEASNSIAINFSTGTGTHTRAASGDITFTASGYKSGATKTLFITCDSTSRTLTFPSSWIWVGPKPTSILASKTGVLTVTSLGTAEANAVASWAVQI